MTFHALLYAFEGFAVQRSASQPSYKLLTDDTDMTSFVHLLNIQIHNYA